MITITDINVVTAVTSNTYKFNVSLTYSGTRSSVYGEMHQYYMKTSGSEPIAISGQELLSDINYDNLENLKDGFFRFIFIQGEVYDSVSGTYLVGDLIYNTSSNRFEKCVNEIPTPKAYDSSDWVITNPEDSTINQSFKSTKDVLMIERSKKTLLDLRELAIKEFLDGGCEDCNESKNTKLRRVDSLLQAANDNFTELNNKAIAQKYIEYIDIIK